MNNHTTTDCPICIGINDPGSEGTLIQKDDLVYQDSHISAFINSFFVGNNPGHVIVVPNAHYKNIYDLPNEIGYKIFDAIKKISIIMKEVYKCDGITTRQNNEPAGDQHAFHYHHHIFPRYVDDNFNQNQLEKRLASPSERKEYADKLKMYLNKV